MANAAVTVDPTTKELKSPNPFNVGNGGSIELRNGGSIIGDAGSTVDLRNATVLLPSAPSTVSNVVSVPTIAALRGTSVAGVPNGIYAAIAGFWANQDGGGGLFVYSSSSSATDNGGTIIAPTVGSGRWLRIYDGVTNVKWFGAKMDGVTDDSAALVAALTASLAVIVPEGDLYIASANIILTRTGTRLFGTGEKSRIVCAAAPATGAIQINGASSPAYRAYVSLENISIVGGGTVGLKLLDVANVDIRNVYVGTGFNRGIELEGALLCSFYNVSSELNVYGLKAFDGGFSGCNLNQFYSCHFNSNTKKAVWWVGGSSVAFDGCGFEGNGVTGQAEGAVEFSSMCSAGVQPGAILKSCWFETNHSANAEFYYGGSGGVVLLGNSWYSTDVKYNIQVANATVSMFGNGANPVLTVGTFGTDSFNVYLDVGSRGVCWNNIAVQVTFDASSQCCFQDTSGRMIGKFNISLTGVMQFWIDNANHADISVDGSNVQFDNPVGNWLFKQQIRSDSPTDGGVNAGAIVAPSGGAFFGKKIYCNDRVLSVNGLGTGNTSAAATPGTIIKKMPIYNTAGTLLGWMPIYDAIT